MDKCEGFDISGSRCAPGATLRTIPPHTSLQLPSGAGGGGGSALLVFQDVQTLLVLGLERHHEVVRGDLAPAVLVHLAREDVVQAW